MPAWIWVEPAVALAVHDEQLAEHGGSSGIRDSNAFESAMARPINLAAYGEPDAADLAAAYAFGLARNHPFTDGNKRTAFVVSELFLALNGIRLLATDADCVLTFLAIASGTMTEQQISQWFRENTKP